MLGGARNDAESQGPTDAWADALGRRPPHRRRCARQMAHPVPSCRLPNAGLSYAVPHLNVPAWLQTQGSEPRTRCGLVLPAARSLSFGGSLLDGEARGKCLPGLHAQLLARRASSSPMVQVSLQKPLRSCAARLWVHGLVLGFVVFLPARQADVVVAVVLALRPVLLGLFLPESVPACLRSALPSLSF